MDAQVACGGNHTLAVCAHDTVQQEKEEKKKGYTQRVMSMFTAKPVTVEVPDSRTHSSGPTTAGSGGITPLDRISDGSMSLMHNGSNGMFLISDGVWTDTSVFVCIDGITEPIWY